MSGVFTWSCSDTGAGALVVCGEVDLQCCRHAAAVLDAAGERPPGPVAVDLSGVTALDAAGLSVLLVLVARLAAADRPVVLHRPSSPVVRRLALSGAADAVWLSPEPSGGGGAPPSDERRALVRARSFRAVERLLHDGTSWGDPCAGPRSRREAATSDARPAPSAARC